MKEGLIIVGIAFAIMAVLVGAIGCMGYYLHSARCENIATLMERSHDYKMLQGCMIKTNDGQWIPLENIKEVTP